MAGNRTPQEDRFTWGQALSNAIKNNMGEVPEEIIQIKGKGNAKPKEDYIPYVQDFVRSGNWHSVDDFHHTDLISADTIRKAGWDMKGNNQKFFTKQEYEDLKNAEQKRVEGDGMKRGGKVKKMASGGMTASKRADGIAVKGKTNCKMY
jgi:hypothetical protein